MSRQPLRWGIIGIGNIVTTTIAPAMEADPRSEIVAVVSRDQGRADAFAAAVGARFATTEYAAMLARPDVDAVFIATPNDQHSGQVVAAAAAGKHVLCDKPIATDLDAARRAVAACRAAGVSLGINFHNRQLPWVQHVRDLIRSGALGTIQTISAEVGSGPRHYTNWRSDPASAGLGSIYNVGVHVLDFIGWMLDARPIEALAMLDATEGVESQALALLRYDNGAMAHIDCNERTVSPRNDVAIHGTSGRVVAHNLTRARVAGTLEVTIGDTTTTTDHPAPEAHRLTVQSFTDDVLSGRTPSPDGDDALESMIVCDAIARSARERRLVEVQR